MSEKSIKQEVLFSLISGLSTVACSFSRIKYRLKLLLNMHFCQFCHILSQKKQIIYQDQTVFAFHDINKASAVQHILVCPMEHIQSVNEVVDPQLISKMKEVGTKILQGFNKGNKFRFGFHKDNHITFTQDKVQYGHMLHPVDKVIAEIKLRAKL